ncbi:MAG: hypothetical protein ACREF3_18235 [Acetobacteraceae bacterium]
MPLNTISLDFIDEPAFADHGRMLGAVRATWACVVTHHRHAFGDSPPSRRNTVMAGLTGNEIAWTERRRFPALD